jgi:uncharacterized membrane protein YphA (DoxX/SURF4 family)
MTDFGRRVYGAAAVALGLVGLAWGDFAAVWQPVPPQTAGYAALAYAAAAVEIAAGVALQGRRTAKPAAMVLAAFFAIFAALWARRIIAAPQLLAVWSGMAEQLAIALGGLMAFATLSGRGRLARVGQAVFGLCLLAFGAAHVVYVKETAAMVPRYLPPGPQLWAYITGAGHAAAGLALISGVLDRLASRLVTAMFVVFGALVWGPQLLEKPGDHMTWAGNAINLALVGAAWIVADAAAARVRA